MGDIIPAAILLTPIADLYAKQFPIMTSVSRLLRYLRILLRSAWLNDNFTIHYFRRNRKAVVKLCVSSTFLEFDKKANPSRVIPQEKNLSEYIILTSSSTSVKINRASRFFLFIVLDIVQGPTALLLTT